MAEKDRSTASTSNSSKTPKPEIKRNDTDKQFDDYFVRIFKQHMSSRALCI
jgi:hypothetical protein